MNFEGSSYLIVFVAGAIFGTVQIFIAVLIIRASNKKGPLVKIPFLRKKDEPTHNDADRIRRQESAGKVKP